MRRRPGSALLLAAALATLAPWAGGRAERVKDLAAVAGVRPN